MRRNEEEHVLFFGWELEMKELLFCVWREDSGGRSLRGRNYGLQYLVGARRKELLALYLERGDRRRRIKWSRKSAVMSADVFLRSTAASLVKRSSSQPCGLGLESLNLSAAPFNLAACSSTRLH